jgi:hypothetical protein
MDMFLDSDKFSVKFLLFLKNKQNYNNVDFAQTSNASRKTSYVWVTVFTFKYL